MAVDNTQLLVSGDGRNNSLIIFQDAYLSRRIAKNSEPFDYNLFSDLNGLFIFVIEGSISVYNGKLNRRDSISINPDGKSVQIVPEAGSFILFIEVPLC